MNNYIMCPKIRTKGPAIGAGALFDTSAPIYVAVVCTAKIYKSFRFLPCKNNFSILLSTSINI